MPPTLKLAPDLYIAFTRSLLDGTAPPRGMESGNTAVFVFGKTVIVQQNRGILT